MSEEHRKDAGERAHRRAQVRSNVSASYQQTLARLIARDYVRMKMSNQKKSPGTKE